MIGGIDVCSSLGIEAICEPDPDTVLLLAGFDTVVLLNEQLTAEGEITVNAIHIFVLGESNPSGCRPGPR